MISPPVVATDPLTILASPTPLDPISPRAYQNELIEECKKRNIIIRADTGTGKTLVAVHIIKWTYAQCHLSKGPHTIQAFLAPTRPLVDQQAQYIQRHLDLRVRAYTGDLEVDLWKAEKWQSELLHLDVFVGTAQIFYDVVSRGFWNFEDVSLLVFDEAHHCRKNHIYNQIMQVHYHRLARQPGKRLPKILGLTASPIWDCKNLVKAQKDIQTLQSDLDARVYEVRRKVTDVEKFTFKPKETIVYFQPPSPRPTEEVLSPPWDRVQSLLREYASENFRQGLQTIVEDLGVYARTLSVVEWLRSLLMVDSCKASISTRLLDPAYQEQISLLASTLEGSLRKDDVPFEQASLKFVTLVNILVDYMDRKDPREFCCIVFVERRRHAQILTTLLSRVARLQGFLRVAALVGHGGNQGDAASWSAGMNHKMQNKTVAGFRSGDFNLTIATSVAEEGLDFRACKLVIRFDNISTWKGYIQSRGRARAVDSEYVVMIPEGSPSKYEEFIGKEAEVKSKLYNRPEDEAIPEAVGDPTPQLICQTRAGLDAILTYSAATGVLNEVCQLIPQDEYYANPPGPEYRTWMIGESFLSQVALPPMAALPPSGRTFRGDPMSTKRDSKRSAAFAACVALRNAEVLDEHFLPRRESKVLEAVDANGRQIEVTDLPEFVPIKCPNPFGNLWLSTELWLHKFTIDFAESGASNLGLMCATRLDPPLGMCLFDTYHPGMSMPVVVAEAVQVQWEPHIAAANISKLDTFSRMVIQVAINRRGYNGQLLFLVVPLLGDTMSIDWELVETPHVAVTSVEEISKYSSLIAPYRPLTQRIFSSYTACSDAQLDSLPAALPAHPLMIPFRKKMANFKTIGHFFRVRFEIEIQGLPTDSLVYLESNFKAEDALVTRPAVPRTSRIVLPLEACKVSHIPLRLWKAISFLPGLTRLLHDGCQVNGLFKKLGVSNIPVRLGIEALTPPGVGVPWDYQTLETMGDAFLKLATTIHVYSVYKRKSEGDMSVVRSKSVDNSYLRRKALDAGLGGYILGQRYRLDGFRAAHLDNGVVLEDGEHERSIPRRVLSDVLEALLGAGFIWGGPEVALQIGNKLDLCFGGPADWCERRVERPFQVDPDVLPVSLLTEAHDRLQAQLGYKFKDPLWLIQALTHRSADSHLTYCYEREEWLGDAVIDLWITEHLYRRFSGLTAEQLTHARASLVANESLGFLALRKLELHKLIRHKSPTLAKACEDCLKNELSRFKTIADFYQDPTNVFVAFNPPKLLNDALEALVGAIFVDSGFQIATAYRSLGLIFEEVLPAVAQVDHRDPLSRFLGLRDKKKCSKLTKEVKLVLQPSSDPAEEEPVAIRRCNVMFHGQVVATGKHHNSPSVAEQRAALEALRLLDVRKIETVDGCIEVESPLWKKCTCREIKESSEGGSEENGPSVTGSTEV